MFAAKYHLCYLVLFCFLEILRDKCVKLHTNLMLLCLLTNTAHSKMSSESVLHMCGLKFICLFIYLWRLVFRCCSLKSKNHQTAGGWLIADEAAVIWRFTVSSERNFVESCVWVSIVLTCTTTPSIRNGHTSIFYTCFNTVSTVKTGSPGILSFHFTKDGCRSSSLFIAVGYQNEQWDQF